MTTSFTLSIPTFNSSQYVVEAFECAINEDLISEIILSDDCSEQYHYEKLQHISKSYSKIKLIKTEKNVGGFKNKYYSVNNSSNDWVYILDSDNHMTKNTLSVIKNIKDLDETICYCPEKLILHHDNNSPFKEVTYKFGFECIGLNEIKFLISNNVEYVDWFLNTGNYILNRTSYLNFLKEKYENDYNDTFAGDVIAMSYYWFKNGGKFKIVDGFEYYHRLRSDSYWNSCGSNSSDAVNKYTNLILSLD